MTRRRPAHTRATRVATAAAFDPARRVLEPVIARLDGKRRAIGGVAALCGVQALGTLPFREARARLACPMNAPALAQLRRKLAADEPTYGLWVTLESATVTEMAVALGLDWVVIDAEHGQLDWREILDHLRAAVRSRTVALVRLAELNAGLIKRALDLGADGVVIPWIETPEELARAVAYAHYPPRGRRGIGGERATCWGRCLAEHVAESEANVLVVPIIESVRAAEQIEQICRVPGVELLQLGPADFSSTAGFPGCWEGPGVAEQLLAIKEVVRRHGKQCGVVATGPDDLLARRAQGFRFLGLGLDAGLLLRSVSGMVEAAGRVPAIRPGFLAPPSPSDTAGQPSPSTSWAQQDPRPSGLQTESAAMADPGWPQASPSEAASSEEVSCGAGPSGAALSGAGSSRAASRGAASACVAEASGVVPADAAARLPREASLPHPDKPPSVAPSPDRVSDAAAVNSTGVRLATTFKAQASRKELERGVYLSPLVGGFNAGLNVTTGWVAFAPRKGLSCHVHPYAELLVVTAGEMLVQVEDRAYQLREGDALCIPAHTPHEASNSSDHRPASIYIAMGAAEPIRTLVPPQPLRRWMPEGASGEPGKEQLLRAALPPAPAPRQVGASLSPQNAAKARPALHEPRPSVRSAVVPATGSDLPRPANVADHAAHIVSWFRGPHLNGLGMGLAVLPADSAPLVQHAPADTVLLAVRGRWKCRVGSQEHLIAEGTALVVPAATEYALLNPTTDEGLVIWVASPGHA